MFVHRPASHLQRPPTHTTTYHQPNHQPNRLIAIATCPSQITIASICTGAPTGSSLDRTSSCSSAAPRRRWPRVFTIHPSQQQKWCVRAGGTCRFDVYAGIGLCRWAYCLVDGERYRLGSNKDPPHQFLPQPQSSPQITRPKTGPVRHPLLVPAIQRPERPKTRICLHFRAHDGGFLRPGVGPTVQGRCRPESVRVCVTRWAVRFGWRCK